MLDVAGQVKACCSSVSDIPDIPLVVQRAIGNNHIQKFANLPTPSREG